MHGHARGAEWRVGSGDRTFARVRDHRAAGSGNTPAAVRRHTQRRGLIDANAQVRFAFKHEPDQAIVSTAPKKMLIDDGIVDQSKTHLNDCAGTIALEIAVAVRDPPSAAVSFD